MGRSTLAVMASTMSLVKDLGFVDVPIRTWGLTSLMMDRRSVVFFPFHSLSSRAKDTWACVRFFP